MSNRPFTSKFVSAVRVVLATGCADGSRMTREQVSTALETEGFSVSPKIIGLAIQDGVFNTAKQAWDLFPGRFGGIRELDLEETAKAEAEFQAQAEMARVRIEKARANAEKARAVKAANKLAKEVPAVQASV